jgi:hypothetical protein
MNEKGLRAAEAFEEYKTARRSSPVDSPKVQRAAYRRRYSARSREAYG